MARAARRGLGPAGDPDRADGRPVRQAALGGDRGAGGIALPAYRGDIVNGSASTPPARRPDPERMFRAYAQAAATLAIRGAGGGADAFHTSHEALLLPFEQALVRRDPDAAASMRARPISCGSASAPPSRARPMSNSSAASPIRSGSNAGRTSRPTTLLAPARPDRPARRAGPDHPDRRMGQTGSPTALPPLLDAVRARRAGRCSGPAIRCTATRLRTAAGTKTRPLERILAELEGFFAATPAAASRAAASISR